MGKTPDFKQNKTIPDLIAETRKPPIMPETGWYRISITENYEAQGSGGQHISTITEALFMNGWNNVTGATNAPAGWYLSDGGEVRMRGKITGGDAGTVVAILPEEVRPQFAETWICAVDGGGTANVTVWPNGSVVVDTFN